MISHYLLLAVLHLASLAAAQQPAPSSPPTAASAQSPAKPDASKPGAGKPDAGRNADAAGPNQAALSRYTLGPDDQLQITVFDEPELTNIYRIGSDGFITFPLIDRIAASGLTVAEFQDRLRAKLADGYIRNPQVRVEVQQYKSQFVIVGGEVRSPGRIPMTGAMTLPEALAAAGSPTSSASDEVILTHAVKPNPDGTIPSKHAESVHVNLNDLQLGTTGRDIFLQDGDTIFVPKAQTFYVTGYVRNSGALVWKPGITVQQAIALAGGVTERGSTSRIRADRVMPNGRLVEVKLDLNSKIQPNDTIKIPAKFF